MPFKKLKPEEHSDATALIAAIEHKDRRFRLFQMLFMVGTFIALIIIIGAQQRTLDGVRDQLTQAQQVAKSQSKEINDSQEVVLRRLDCLAVYFNQRNRADLTIQDINRCTLERNGTPQQFFIQKPGEQPQTTPTEQPSSLPLSPAKEQGQAPTQSTPQNPTPTPIITEPRPPLTIGLPLIDRDVCVLQLLCLN